MGTETDPETLADKILDDLDDAIADLTLDGAIETAQLVEDGVDDRLTALRDDRRRRDESPPSDRGPDS